MQREFRPRQDDSKDSDVGIVEAILTYVASIMHRQAVEEALSEFRESRPAHSRSKKAPQRHADSAQLTLRQAWAMGNIDTDAVMASGPASADLADTMQARLQLLRLGNQWARLSQLQRENIVAAVMQDLPDYYITKLADPIAQLYNGAGEPQPPTALLAPGATHQAERTAASSSTWARRTSTICVILNIR